MSRARARARRASAHQQTRMVGRHDHHFVSEVERDAGHELTRVARALHVSKHFLVSCLEAFTVEVLILIAIRLSYAFGAVSLAVLFTR